MLTETGITGVLEASHYEAVDKFLPFLGDLVDGCSDTSGTAITTSVCDVWRYGGIHVTQFLGSWMVYQRADRAL